MQNALTIHQIIDRKRQELQELSELITKAERLGIVLQVMNDNLNHSGNSVPNKKGPLSQAREKNDIIRSKIMEWAKGKAYFKIPDAVNFITTIGLNADIKKMTNILNTSVAAKQLSKFGPGQYCLPKQPTTGSLKESKFKVNYDPATYEKMKALILKLASDNSSFGNNDATKSIRTNGWPAASSKLANRLIQNLVSIKKIKRLAAGKYAIVK